MRHRRQVFSGRVIFDHLPKTAGQAVNVWLTENLGAGCVTPNLIGGHRDLIRRYGGEYSVISAHVDFQGSDLDPRYHYMTCLREPIDRAVSWLFFLVKNHESAELPGLWEQAERFVALADTPGSDLLNFVEESFDQDFLRNIRNPYVEHFAGISPGSGRSERQKIDAALDSIARYDVWGLYESLPDFLSDVASLIEIPVPAHLQRVNMTRTRPQVGEISPSLRTCLEALNELDLEFYRELSERWARERVARTATPDLMTPRWQPYESVAHRTHSVPEFTLISATIDGGDTCSYGQFLRFHLVFSIDADIDQLGVGVHLSDEDGRWAFGTSNALLDRPLVEIAPGTYSLRYYLVANLPEGQYAAGFEFSCSRGNRIEELACYEQLVPFRVVVPRETPSVGYMSIPADFACDRIGDAVTVSLDDTRGRLATDAVLGGLVVNESFELPVTLENASSQTWASTTFLPICLSYRWLDSHGNVTATSTASVPLDVNFVAPGQALPLSMHVVAPSVSGRFKLVLTLSRDGEDWPEEQGFQALILALEVEEADESRLYRGADIRLSTHVGQRGRGAMSSIGQEGYLLFGPYASLSQGRYVVSLQGYCALLDSGWIDVSWDRGGYVLMRHEVTPGERDGEIAAFGFELVTPISDLEIRVWVPSSADMRVDTLRIVPIRT
ncbi:Wzt carbohydrate-binding domain-containing protein [Burkholderia lata]|uniref:Wzt carbohydrate-binding domain-containing protein n=1 Tax=Burkholderia lata (strain ATCC 17760 / DSM 23089 / LMG 22485 / NCIMB 9086 / R18194 / 383) TaxID=482957 RepID=UPI003999708E